MKMIEKAYINNFTFLMHYGFTAPLLLIAAFIVTSYKIIESPIICYINGAHDEMMNKFCWSQGTFTLHRSSSPILIGRHNWTQREEKIVKDSEDDTKSEIELSACYQWFNSFLILQAALFLLPYFIWNFSGGNRKLGVIINGLDSEVLLVDEKLRIAKTFEFFKHSAKKLGGNIWLFHFCELLNFANVIFQLLIMDGWVNSYFSSNGRDMIGISQKSAEKRTDAMIEIFPRVINCSTKTLSISGESKNAVCLLTQNFLYEKIIIFAWFWFFLLAILTSIQISWIWIVFVSKKMRAWVFYSRGLNTTNSNLLVEHVSYERWFLFLQMTKHIHRHIITQILLDFRGIYFHPPPEP